MATLRISVVTDGTGPLSTSEADKQRVFVFSGSTPVSAGPGHIAGGVGARVPPGSSEQALDRNYPRVPGALCVTGYRPVTFDSSDFSERQELVSQVATAIEKGYVVVVDVAVPGTPLTRADLIGYL